MELYVARDKDGALYLYTDKPRLSKKTFFLAEYGVPSMKLSSDSFPEVTFENSPKKVELKLVEE